MVTGEIEYEYGVNMSFVLIMSMWLLVFVAQLVATQNASKFVI